MRECWVDAAIICANGHVVNASAVSYPELTTEFCEVCGAVTLRRCRACGAIIRGEYHPSGGVTLCPIMHTMFAATVHRGFTAKVHSAEA